MARALRYRRGIDRHTGRPLVGRPHLLQSLAVIWTTRVNTMPMLLEFGSNLRGNLAKDMTPALALSIYNDLIASAHRWEPEYRVLRLQLVQLGESGLLALRHAGLYYPEGRYGNYRDVETVDVSDPLRLAAPRLARAAA